VQVVRNDLQQQLRWATTWLQQTWAKSRGAVPLWWRELGPHLTKCGLGPGAPSNQMASSSIQPFGHNRHGPKIVGLRSLNWEGELGPHLTQCRLHRGLRTKWHLNPSSRVTMDMGRKLGAVPL